MRRRHIMNKNWKQIKVPFNQRSIIWVFLSKSSSLRRNEKPLIVIQTEPDEDIKINFKEEVVGIEIEKI